jgi:hypothetical protein
MTALRDASGETVALHILDATPARRTIAQVESVHALRRTYTDIGAPLAPHQGAPGKVLLAFAEEPLRERVLSRDLRSAITKSKVDVTVLLAWLGHRHGDARLNAAAEATSKAVETVLATREQRTPDLGGTATTAEMDAAIAHLLRG